jgi:hypothetical protein
MAALTLSEGAALRRATRERELEGERAPKARRKTALCAADWRVVGPEENFVWRLNESPATPADGTPQNLPRRASILQVFLAVFTPTVLASLRAACKTEVTAKALLKAWALRGFIQASCVAPVRGETRHGLQEAFERAKDIFQSNLHPQETTRIITWRDFAFILNSVFFPVDWIKAVLSTAFSELIHVAPFICLDEKLRHYTGHSPCIRQILTKPDKIGHWVSEVCIRLSSTGRAFCMRLFPVTACVAEGHTTKVSALVEWATLRVDTHKK